MAHSYVTLAWLAREIRRQTGARRVQLWHAGAWQVVLNVHGVDKLEFDLGPVAWWKRMEVDALSHMLTLLVRAWRT